MKYYILLLFVLCSTLINAQVGIGTTNPDASSTLEIQSTTKGVLIPRMSKIQRNAIASPATGLLIYQNDDVPGFFYYDGSVWLSLSTSNGEFKSTGGIIKQTTNINDDFVIGSNTLEFSTQTNRMFFDKSKGAFRVGRNNNTNWNDLNIGLYSFAIGNNTKASGSISTAMGFNSTASGLISSAMGYSSSATGPYSMALGSGTTASGNNSTAIGNITTASGLSSTALGFNSTASGTNSTAIGSGTSASGSVSTTMGNNTTASGNNSTAMGNNTTAKSFSETTIGIYNTDYIPNSTSVFNGNDRLFSVGNGTSIIARSNALTI